MAKREQFCFNCGESLGVYDAWGEHQTQTCGKQECEREARYQRQAERDSRYMEAAEDDFSRYEGRW